jgi:hypothetical protein
MVPAENRAAWFGGCRRPLGRRSVRHSVNLVGLRTWFECGGAVIDKSRSLQKEVLRGGSLGDASELWWSGAGVAGVKYQERLSTAALACSV